MCFMMRRGLPGLSPRESIVEGPSKSCLAPRESAVEGWSMACLAWVELFPWEP